MEKAYPNNPIIFKPLINGNEVKLCLVEDEYGGLFADEIPEDERSMWTAVKFQPVNLARKLARFVVAGVPATETWLGKYDGMGTVVDAARLYIEAAKGCDEEKLELDEVEIQRMARILDDVKFYD